MALAESGAFDEAARVQGELIAQVRERASAADVERLEGALRRYRNRQPMRIE